MSLTDKEDVLLANSVLLRNKHTPQYQNYSRNLLIVTLAISSVKKTNSSKITITYCHPPTVILPWPSAALPVNT